MFEKMMIRSKFRNYAVNFVDDFTLPLKRERKTGSFLIVDSTVSKLYVERIEGLLTDDNILVIEATEDNKIIDKCKEIIELLVEKKVRRDHHLIAIGGGVIQDITSFTASILYRGVDWIFFPTTLLAQADSCIGSKTSINFREYKNLLGGFYPPSNIFIDEGFLQSLDIAAIKSGIGEMLHFYLVDGNTSLAEELMSNYDELLASPIGFKRYIFESLMIKKRVIELDEFDRNERNLFNYGHTFGHAIETVSHYSVTHGLAVTLGMDISNFVSFSLGHMDRTTFESMHHILSKNIPPFVLSSDTISEYFKALSRDKKNIGNSLGCILSSGPGVMRKTQLPLDDKLKSIILAYFSAV